MTIAVNIEQVSKHYGQLTALQSLNFTIPKGSFFGLLGPNGAGKSTLISIMAGLVYPSKGQVQIMGHDVRHAWRQARQCLGVVPQELVVDMFFTVNQLLTLQSGYFGLGRANRPWLQELLHVLNLEDKSNTLMMNLSGGMKRRVLIAQALVHKPAVVVLDEPTAGVDIELRKLLWEFIKRLHQAGHTIVLTTHYLEEAENLCEHIAILNQGQLIALDHKQALLSHHPYRLLYLAIPNLELSQLPPALHPKIHSSTTADQLVLQLHQDHDPIATVLDTLRSANLHFTDLHTQQPRLEDVFLSLTHRAVPHSL